MTTGSWCSSTCWRLLTWQGPGGFEVLVDGREHPRQSLLQPNLASFQGAAIVVRMDGPPLTLQELSAIFAPPPAKLRGRSCNYGSGLLSCFGVTDLPFTASRGLLYMFDPQGKILTASLNVSTRRRKVPIGKAYSLDGTDLVTRFSDQLLPLGFTPDSHYGLQVNPTEGTVIRLPLRDASEGDPGGFAGVREALDFFQEHLASSLLFLRAVEEVAVKVHVPGGEATTELMRCSILPQHVELRQVGWLPFPFPFFICLVCGRWKVWPDAGYKGGLVLLETPAFHALASNEKASPNRVSDSSFDDMQQGIALTLLIRFLYCAPFLISFI
jgi:hypothetical protein